MQDKAFAEFAIHRLALFLRRELSEDRFLTQAESDWLKQYEKEHRK